MDRFARNFNLSSGAAAIVVACFLTLPGLRVSAENPSGVNAEVNAPQNIDIKGRIVSGHNDCRQNRGRDSDDERL